MKVLHLNFSDRGGGAEEFSLSLTKHQDNAKLLVSKKQTSNTDVIEIPRTFRIRLFRFLDKALWKLGFRVSFRSLLGFQNAFHGTMSMLQRLDAFLEADIIHLHNIHGEFFDLKAVRKIAREKFIVWTSHDLWIATGGEGGIPKGTSDRIRKKTYPLKGGWIDSRKSQLCLKKKIFSQSKNIHVVAPSLDHQKKIEAVHPEIKATMIRNGIDTDTFHADPEKKIQNTIPRLLVFNTSSIYKNTKEVLNVIRGLSSEFELHVIGDQLAKSKTKNVVNHGFITDRNKLAKLFQSIDIGVFSSRAETFGLLPAELAACGAKVFLNEDLPVFREHVHLYGASLYRDEKHLLELLYAAIHNIDETRKLGYLSADMVRQNLNRKDILKEYEDLYRKLVENFELSAK